MIIVRLVGGLGNQLFQYALGRSLSILHNRELKLDIFGYEGNVPDPQKGIRVFGLSHFNITAREATRDDLSIFKNYFRTDLVGKFYKGLDRLMPGAYYDKPYIVEPSKLLWRFDPNLLGADIKNPVYLRGFWQTEKYFNDNENIIREEFLFKDSADEVNGQLIKKIEETNSVCIHVRHGDNANGIAAHLGMLSLEYYKKAVAEIRNKIKNPHFYIFSDDPEWVMNNLKFDFDVEFVGHNKDKKNYEDLRLMTHCKHHIIGNSTFSWWGAWLGKKEGQLVIAPKYYQVGQDMSKMDFYPKSWILM